MAQRCVLGACANDSESCEQGETIQGDDIHCNPASYLCFFKLVAIDRTFTIIIELVAKQLKFCLLLDPFVAPSSS